MTANIWWLFEVLELVINVEKIEFKLMPETQYCRSFLYNMQNAVLTCTFISYRIQFALQIVSLRQKNATFTSLSGIILMNLRKYIQKFMKTR